MCVCIWLLDSWEYEDTSRHIHSMCQYHSLYLSISFIHYLTSTIVFSLRTIYRMTPISILVYHINHHRYSMFTIVITPKCDTILYPQKGNQSLFGEAMQTKRGASIKQVLWCILFLWSYLVMMMMIMMMMMMMMIILFALFSVDDW